MKNSAAVRFSADQIAAASGEDGWASWAFSVLWQRRQARERLGLRGDDLDAGLVPPPALRSNRLLSLDDVASMRVPDGARVMFWTLSEFDTAQRDLFGPFPINGVNAYVWGQGWTPSQAVSLRRLVARLVRHHLVYRVLVTTVAAEYGVPPRWTTVVLLRDFWLDEEMYLTCLRASWGLATVDQGP